jgi:hypothetical protein
VIVSSSLKRKLAVGGATLAAAALGGGAYAATQTQTNPRQAYLNDVAKRLGVSPEKLSSALKGAAIDRLEAAVKAGKLTQAQADAIKRRIEQGGIGPLGPGPFLAPGRGFPGHPFLAPPPGAPGHPFLRHFGGHLAFGGPIAAGPIAAAAKYLGLTEAQLRNQLMAGKSLAQIAQAQHKSVSGLQSAIQAAVKARLDKAVSAGFLTKAQEQRILNKMIPAIINRKIEKPGFGPRFRKGQLPGSPPPGAPGAAISPSARPVPPPAIVY